MVTTLNQLVERVRDDLNQGNRDQLATFKGWIPSVGDPKTGVVLEDVTVGSKLNSALVELGCELVYVKSFDTLTGTAVCPAWFRQRNGSPANTSYPVDSVAVINPRWTYWTIVQKLIDGIRAMDGPLFAVKTATLTTAIADERYLLPADCENLLDIQLKYPGAGNLQRRIGTWSVKTKNPDGNRYLHIPRLGINGLTIDITYKAKPTLPDPANGSFDWVTTGLPDTADDLPVLYAKAKLVPSMETSRAQTHSIEQSERSKYVQGGTGTSVSRLWMQMYEARLEEERRKLLNLYPPLIHRELNG